MEHVFEATKAFLHRYRITGVDDVEHMFQNSNNEWVAGLDVEYTTVLEKERFLKEEEKKKPAMIQVCMHNLCLVYHICHADVRCQNFEDFLKDERVKFVTIVFNNDKEVLGQIGLVVH